MPELKSLAGADSGKQLSSRYWEKDYAIPQIKFVVGNFKYNWENELFNSNADFNQGKKLLDELEMDLRKIRDNLDFEINFHSREYISTILKRVQSLKKMVPVPFLIAQFYSKWDGNCKYVGKNRKFYKMKRRYNNALEPSFARYVRFGGDLAGFSVASLLAKRTPNLARGHSHRSWPASARSPGQFFVVRSSPANAAQRGVNLII